MPNEVIVHIKTVLDNTAVKNSAKGIIEALKPVGAAFAGSGLLSMAAPLGAAGIAMGAFGAIAKPTLDKVEKALTSTGTAGKKAWAALDPAQTAIAKNIQGLQKSFDGIAKSMEPVIEGVLNLALHVAHDLMPALNPLAKAGASVISDFLKPLDSLLRSNTFKQFTDTMASAAKQIGPVLGATFSQLLKILMQLFIQVMPSGVKILSQLLPAISKMLAEAVPWISAMAKIVAFTITWLDKNKLLVPALWGLVTVLAAVRLGLTANPVGLFITAIALLAEGIVVLWKKSSLFRDILKEIAVVMLQTGIIIVQVNKQIINAILNVIGAILHGLKDAFGWIPGGVGSALKSASAAFDRFHSGVNGALDGMIGKMRSWQGELDASKNKANTVTQVISGDFGKQLLATSGAAKMADTLGAAIGRLHSKNLAINMNGKGQYSLSEINANTGKQKGAAAGTLVSGGIPGQDSVLIKAMPGELVVPTHMVNSGAVDHLRGRIPGFAGGGVVSGNLSGSYVTNMYGSFQNSMTVAMVAAMRAALRAAEAAAAQAASSGSGALGGDPAKNKALARSMFPWPASMWGSYDYVEMREAGYNRFARNPSSGAYGIPQALPPTKMPFAAQAAGGSHAGPQISWMYDYIRSRYGNPVNAAAHERKFNWYDNGGWLPTGASIAVNNTGHPERVMGPGECMTLEISGGDSEFEKFMSNFIKHFVRVKGGGNVQRAFGRS